MDKQQLHIRLETGFVDRLNKMALDENRTPPNMAATLIIEAMKKRDENGRDESGT